MRKIRIISIFLSNKIKKPKKNKVMILYQKAIPIHSEIEIIVVKINSNFCKQKRKIKNNRQS